MLGKRSREDMASGPYFKRNSNWERQSRPLHRAPPVRPWVVTSPAIIHDHHKPDVFSIATFNVLAQDLLEDHLGSLYNHCPRQFLEWEYRKLGLMSLLTSCSADVSKSNYVVVCSEQVPQPYILEPTEPTPQYRLGGDLTNPRSKSTPSGILLLPVN